MSNTIKVCPILAALVRSRALRKIEARWQRSTCFNELSPYCRQLHQARQRIKAILAFRLAKNPQQSEMTQREFEGMKSNTYENQSQKFESQKFDTYPQKTETMKSDTYEITSQFFETYVLPSVDFLRL